MRVLLDTHTLYWAAREPTKLSARARDVIQDSAMELVISAITPWEMATKVRQGKWPEAETLLLGYDEVVARLGATQLAFDVRHGIAAGGLAWDHRDPFDRALAAQSILEQTPLVTGDRAFSTLSGLQVLW